MSNPTGPQDPYGQQGEGSSGGSQGGSSWGPGQGSGSTGGQDQAGGYPGGGDMGGGYSAPPPPPGYYGGGPGAPMFGGTEKNNLGVWALVLGILGIVCCGVFTAIPAVILGNKSKEAAAQGQATNGGLGQAGVVLGWVGIVFGILYLLWLFVFGGLAVISEMSSGTSGL